MTDDMTEKVAESEAGPVPRGRRRPEGEVSESEARRYVPAPPGTDGKWAAVAMAVVVLVALSFATGWHFGRRWGRMMGW
jgi:hypothetical protein